jgi:hypothetical protein
MKETNLLSLIKAISAIKLFFKTFTLPFFDLLDLEEEKLIETDLFFSNLFLELDFGPLNEC